MSPFKEFTVTRNDAEVEAYFEMARAVDESTDKVFPRGICPHSQCDRAMSCRVVKECFSGEYPPSLAWGKSVSEVYV
jgi:hypothetical protein